MASRILKWVAGGLEALWGFPVIGGMLVVSMYWTPLLLMLALHIVALVISVREGKKKTGHILGIITSCVAWIPLVGMVMHILSAIFLMTEAHAERPLPEKSNSQIPPLQDEGRRDA